MFTKDAIKRKNALKRQRTKLKFWKSVISKKYINNEEGD